MNWQDFTECSAQLQTLLAQAQTAITNDSRAEKISAQQQLLDFVHNCNCPMAQDLCDIAKKAINNVFEVTLATALAQIRDRTSELDRLTRSLNTVAGDANRSASLIRLDQARKAVDATVQAVDALKQLQGSLKTDQPDENALANSI